jgi:hypothetical protein
MPSGDEAGRRAVRLNLHGHVIDVRCAVPALRQVIHDVLGPLAVDELPDGFQPIEALIEPYDADVVARHLSTAADRVAMFGDYAELWRDGERCWLIDESWGLSEINLMKRTWRSWVLPQSPLDAIRIFEQAMLWPLSQVLTTRGMSLVPAASITRGGRGFLILAPFSLEPELALYAQEGHELIGQRWTAIREENGRQLLLHVPARIECSPIPQLRSRSRVDGQASLTSTQWIDLSRTTKSKPYAWCDGVLIVEPGRRAVASVRPLTGASAVASVKRAWPMPDVGGVLRHSQIATRLGQQVPVFQVELCRDPAALVRMLESMPTAAGERAKLQPSVYIPERRAIAG